MTILHVTQIKTWRALVQVSQVPCSCSKGVPQLKAQIPGAPSPYILLLPFDPEDGDSSFPGMLVTISDSVTSQKAGILAATPRKRGDPALKSINRLTVAVSG
jgi:hypothetical protein